MPSTPRLQRYRNSHSFARVRVWLVPPLPLPAVVPAALRLRHHFLHPRLYLPHPTCGYRSAFGCTGPRTPVYVAVPVVLCHCPAFVTFHSGPLPPRLILLRFLRGGWIRCRLSCTYHACVAVYSTLFWLNAVYLDGTFLNAAGFVAAVRLPVLPYPFGRALPLYPRAYPTRIRHRLFCPAHYRAPVVHARPLPSALRVRSRTPWTFYAWDILAQHCR